MKLLYFAWLRSTIGIDNETVVLPPGVIDVNGVLAWLKTRGPGYAAALGNPAIVRVAVNQEYARPDHPVAPDDEVALFPPVTGG